MDVFTRMFEVYFEGKTEMENRKSKETLLAAFRILEEVFTPLLDSFLFDGKTMLEQEKVIMHLAKGLKMIVEGGMTALTDAAAIDYAAAFANATTDIRRK